MAGTDGSFYPARGIGLKYWLSRIIGIEVVYINCSKLFEGLECTVLSGTLNNTLSHSIRIVGDSPTSAFLLS